MLMHPTCQIPSSMLSWGEKFNPLSQTVVQALQAHHTWVVQNRLDGVFPVAVIFTSKQTPIGSYSYG